MYAFHVHLHLALPAAPANDSAGWGDPNVPHGVSIGSLDVPLCVLLDDLIPQRSVTAISPWGWVRGMPQLLREDGGTEWVLASAVVGTHPILIPAAPGRHGSLCRALPCTHMRSSWSI